jgi:hypothetical protein
VKNVVCLIIALAWLFEHGYRDMVEFTRDGGRTWEVLPGPYALDAAGNEYRVDIRGHSGHLFRVRRDYGIPWL